MKRQLIAAIASAIVWFNAPFPVVAADLTFHLDAATIEKSGVGGSAVILIPGLGCGQYVFDAVAADLAKGHVVYRVAFDGFDDHGTAAAPYLDNETRSIADLIAREHLVKPMLIGHSLGGHIALKIAETQPGTIGGVLAIDALPMFPPLQPGETMDARRALADRFTRMMAGATDDAYRTQIKAGIAALVSSPANVDLVTAHALKSDRATYAGAAADMMSDDLTPNLGAITAPVTVLVPSPNAQTDATMSTIYTNLYAGTRHLSIQVISDSKHFIMLDQPARFRAAVTAFVQSASAP